MEQTAESYSIRVPETVLGAMQGRRNPIFPRGHKYLYAIAGRWRRQRSHECDRGAITRQAKVGVRAGRANLSDQSFDDCESRARRG